jgi:hypothetical protein
MRPVLWTLAAAMLTAFGAFFIEQPSEEPPPLPSDIAELARRLASHPTDWGASSAIADRALDGDMPGRVETWSAAEALTVRLSPNFVPARTGYIRGGLFHWYELGDADRKNVLATLTPLMRDPGTFERLAPAIFELTGNLAFLRSAQPHTITSLERLLNIAARNGLFDDYRALRGELVTSRTRALVERLDSLPPSQIIASLPMYPTRDEQPMIVAALRTLHQRPLEVDPGNPNILEGVIDYAVRHRLTPLDGLRPVIRERTWASGFARGELARALGDSVRLDEFGLSESRLRGEIAHIRGIAWDGACGPALCNRATADVDGPRTLLIEIVGENEVPGYIECYVDDTRVWEGPVKGPVPLTVGASGTHRIEIRLANPQGRNLDGRRFRIS